jgi:small nuclear ribonucleoprotein (snRNP)-like protein
MQRSPATVAITSLGFVSIKTVHNSKSGDSLLCATEDEMDDHGIQENVNHPAAFLILSYQFKRLDRNQQRAIIQFCSLPKFPHSSHIFVDGFMFIGYFGVFGIFFPRAEPVCVVTSGRIILGELVEHDQVQNVILKKWYIVPTIQYRQKLVELGLYVIRSDNVCLIADYHDKAWTDDDNATAPPLPPLLQQEQIWQFRSVVYLSSVISTVTIAFVPLIEWSICASGACCKSMYVGRHIVELYSHHWLKGKCQGNILLVGTNKTNSIRIRLIHVTASHNKNEGYDVDEPRAAIQTTFEDNNKKPRSSKSYGHGISPVSPTGMASVL